MEAFEEYLEVKQVGKINLCQIWGCFLNTHQGKAIKQPIACIFCQEQHSLSLSPPSLFPSSSLQMNEIQDQENYIRSLMHFSSLQEYRTHMSTNTNTHTRAQVPLDASAAATTKEQLQDCGGR